MLLTNILSLDFVTSGKKGKFANSLQFEINLNDNTSEIENFISIDARYDGHSRDSAK